MIKEISNKPHEVFAYLGSKKVELRYLVILFSFLLFPSGCQKAPGVAGISKDYETLQEGDFEFQYPKDWKISSESNYSDPNQRETIYYFSHPRNKDLLITIEIISFSKPVSNREAPVRKILSKKVRSSRGAFSKASYTQFDFTAFKTHFAGYQATKLVVKGSKKGIERETVIIILPRTKDFYVISYQWFSNWTKYMRRSLSEIVNTFKLTR